jgi:hypothetical protein
VLENPVDDARSVEAGHHGHAPRHGAGGVTALLLHPAHVELDVRARRGQWIEPAFGAHHGSTIRRSPDRVESADQLDRICR